MCCPVCGRRGTASDRSGLADAPRSHPFRDPHAGRGCSACGFRICPDRPRAASLTQGADRRPGKPEPVRQHFPKNACPPSPAAGAVAQAQPLARASQIGEPAILRGSPTVPANGPTDLRQGQGPAQPVDRLDQSLPEITARCGFLSPAGAGLTHAGALVQRWRRRPSSTVVRSPRFHPQIFLASAPTLGGGMPAPVAAAAGRLRPLAWRAAA